MEATIDITPDLMAGFLDEASEHLEALNSHLMAFEAAAETAPVRFDNDESREQMNTMFRAAHSLKGLSATFGFSDINRLTHTMETLFDQAREGKHSFDLATLETLLRCVDNLESLVGQLTDPSGQFVDVDAALAELQTIIDGGPVDPSPTAEPAPAPDAAPAAPPAQLDTLLDDPELRTLFLETTEEAIDDLNQKLLALEQDSGEAMLNDVFRVAHTLKGACGAAGLGDVQSLTHQMETVFDSLRSGQLGLSDTLMAGLFRVADRLREVVDEVRHDAYHPWADDQVQSVLAEWTGSPDAAASVAEAASEPEKSTEASAGSLLPDVLGVAESGFWIRVSLNPTAADRELQAFVVFGRIKSIGDVAYVAPDLEAEGVEVDAGFEVVIRSDLASVAQAAEIQALLSSFDVREVTVDAIGLSDESASEKEKAADVPAPTAAPPPPRVAPAASKASVPPKPPAAQAAKKPTPENKRQERGGPVAASQDTIRVDVERLDQLMNLGGELVINRARFQQVERQFKTVFTGKDCSYIAEDIAARLERLGEAAQAMAQTTCGGAAEAVSKAAEGLCHDFGTIRGLVDRVSDTRNAMHDFGEAVGTLDRLSASLQKRIMDTRMVPVGPLFTRFRRVVRDIAKELGKKIRIEIRGENTELDKRMIDELADPLTHIIRNAADHGIEVPAAREAAGKPPEAIIALEAYHQGNTICIEIRDDGRGIDLDAVRGKILSRELASPAQVEQMSDRELVQYIFHAGFPTAAQVSDLSGRGMGLDIVTSKLAKLNGIVEVDTVPGQGTTCVIKLPLTLAIVASVLTRIGEATYAIPLESVAEIITLERDEIRTIQTQKVVQVRGKVVPVFFLEDLLTSSHPELRTGCCDSQSFTLVVIGVQGERIGLVVDRMLGQEEVVIKSLAENYRNVAGFAGATIMGDGCVALILDAAYMMNCNHRTDERPGASAGKEAPRPPAARSDTGARS